jgi:hypothetical protein
MGRLAKKEAAGSLLEEEKRIQYRILGLPGIWSYNDALRCYNYIKQMTE